MSDLRILLQSELDTSEKSIKRINDQIKQISKSVGKLNIGIDASDIEKLHKSVQQIQNQTGKNNKGVKIVDQESAKILEGLESNIDIIVNKYKQLGNVKVSKNLDLATKEAKDFTIELQKANGEIERINYEGLKIARPDGNFDYAYRLDSIKQVNDEMKQREQILQKEQQTRKAIQEQERKNRSEYENWWKNSLLQQDKEIKNREQILKEEQKIRNAIEKENKEQEEKTRKLQEQLKLFKEQQRINVDNLKRRFGDKADNEALDGYLRRVNNLKTTAPDVNKSMRQLNLQFKDISSNVRTSASHVLGFGDALSTALQKFPIWLVAGSITFLPIRAFQDAIDQIITIDDKMTELKRVMDAPPQAYNRMLEESIQLGDKLSSSVNDILTAVSGFGRQGFSENEVMYLAEASTVLKNISDLNADEAMDSLTSVMIQFKKEASGVIEIADKFNEIDNNFSVTTKILAEGAAKAGAVASAYSVSLDSMLGYITAISAATRESGSVVGNSLKSIFSRLNLNQSQNALKAVGVVTRNVNGELKSASEILDSLSTRWGSLTQETKQNLATTVAGRYQLSRFLALMNNYQMAVDATSSAISSQGSSMREHSEYTKSLTARIERLKNAWTELTLEMGDAVLTDSIILTVESLREITDIASKVTKVVGVLPFVLGGVSSALIIFSKRFRTAVVDMKIFGAASEGLAVSLRSLKIAMRGLLATTGVGLVFAGIGFAIEKLIGQISDYQKKQKELKQQQDEINKSYSKNSEEIKELAREYELLNTQVANGNLSETSQEYLDVQNQLGGLLPILISHEDERGNKILRNVDAVKQELEYAEKLRKNYEQTQIHNFENDLSDRADQIKDLQKEIERLQKAQTTGYANYEGSSTNLQAQRDQIANERELQQLLLETNDYVKNKSDLFLSNSGATQNLTEASQKLITSFIDENNNIKEAIENGESYEDVVSNLVQDTTDFGEKLSEFNSVIDSGSDRWVFMVDSLIKAGKKYGLTAKEVYEYVEEYTNSLDENTNALSENSEVTWEKVSATEALLGITDDQIEKTKQAIKIVSLLSHMENLSAQQKEMLAGATAHLEEMYPHLTGNIYDNIDAIISEVEVYSELNNASGYNADLMMTNQDSITMSTIEASNQRIKALQNEAKALRDIIDVYAQSQPDDLIAENGFIKSIFSKLSDVNAEISEAYETRRNALYDGDTSGGGSSSSKSSSTTPEPTHKDTIDALIRQYNIEQELLALDSQKLQKQLELAKSQGDINAQLEITKQLTENEGKRLTELNKVKDALHEQANIIRDNNKQWDTSKWFDKNNQETVAYINQFKNATKEQQEHMQKVFSELQALKNAYTDTNVEMTETNSNIQELSSTISDLNFDKINQGLEDIRKGFHLLDFDAEVSRKRLQLLEEGTVEYMEELQKQNDILLERHEVLKQEGEYIREQLKNQELTTEQIDELTKKLQENTIAQLDNNLAIESNNDTIKTNYEQLADDIVEIYKETYRQQQKVINDGINQELDALEKAHNKKMEMLDDELASYEKVINEKLRALDEEEDEEDFQKGLTKLQGEQLELQQRINVLALDDSREATAERAKLEEELQKKIEEIEDHKTKRSRDLRKQNLHDQKDAKEQEIQDEKESAEFIVEINGEMYKGTYENAKEWIGEKQKLWDTYFNNLLNDERKFAEIREEVLEGNFDNILDDFATFEVLTSEHMGIIGKSISQNLIDKLTEAQEKMQEISKSKVTVDVDNSALVSKMQANSIEYHTASPTRKKELHEENKRLAAEVGAVFNPQDYHWYKDGKRLYHEGGFVADKTPNRIGELVDKLFNTRPNEKVVKSLVGELQVPPQNIQSNFIPNMKNLIGGIVGGGSQSNVIQFDSLIKIDSIQDGSKVNFEEIANKSIDIFIKKMKPYGFIR